MSTESNFLKKIYKCQLFTNSISKKGVRIIPMQCARAHFCAMFGNFLLSWNTTIILLSHDLAKLYRQRRCTHIDPSTHIYNLYKLRHAFKRSFFWGQNYFTKITTSADVWVSSRYNKRSDFSVKPREYISPFTKQARMAVVSFCK